MYGFVKVTESTFKMKLYFSDIELADTPVLEMILDSERSILRIYYDRIFRISDKRWLGKTSITISEWKELHVEKFVIQNPLEKGRTFQINWKNEIETFEIIQEIKHSDKELRLSGFSKKSGAWLTYRFKSYDCNIETYENNSTDNY